MNQQFELLPSYLCVEYMETWCFRRWMTSPEAPGLLTEAAGEWCARPQWWWTAGLGGARPGHRWAVGHCRPGHPTASAGLRPHCTADQGFQRWNPLQNILQGPPTNSSSAEQKKHNWGHPTRDDNWKYSQHHIWKSLSLRKRCIFHFEEFALYGANQSLLQTSVEMPKSLFLVQKNKSTLQKVLAICLLSVTPLVAGQANGWKRSTKKTAKELLSRVRRV